MTHIDLDIRLHRGDTVIIGDSVIRIMAIKGDEIQVAAPGAMADTIYKEDEFAEKIAKADYFTIVR